MIEWIKGGVDMFLRIRMYLLLRKLNNEFSKSNSDLISGSDLKSLSLSEKDFRTLKALAAVNAVDLDEGDDKICAVGKSDGEITYLLERSELWFNRIASFILGIITAVVIEWLIRSIP